VKATSTSIPESAPGESGARLSPASPLARLTAAIKRHKRLVRVSVLALIVVFVAFFIQKTWAQVPSNYSWRINWPLLAVGYLLLVTQELSFALIWRSILARLGSPLDVRSAEQIYLNSEFVRYIPGNVWHVLTRILWAEGRGVLRSTGFASMTIELATKIASAALVFALSLLAWNNAGALGSTLGQVGHEVVLTVGLVGVPLLLVGLHPRVLTGALNFALRKLGRQSVAFRLGYGDVLAITLLWSLSWVVAGVGFYLIVLALWAAPLSLTACIMAIGIYAIGWDIGFLSFITPSGLGFREAAIAALLGVSLTGLVPIVPIALMVALVARLLGTAAELVCVAGAHFLPGGRAATAKVEPAP
jgi:glycosyltransferase 2 family protein